MAAVESKMLPLGTKAPGFCLPDPAGQTYQLQDNAAAYLIMFICNHCPFVKHVRTELARLGTDYNKRNVAIYAINSNDAEAYPGDSAENMQLEAETWGYEFPYLIDADQSVASSYDATCTPDFYLFDAQQAIVYRGQLDDSRPSNDAPIDGRDLRAALNAVLEGKPVDENQRPSVGCSIKWKSGNEPGDS
jgi:peroxiredoxin